MEAKEAAIRIGILTWGSDGDIRPFCALAGGLSIRGHKVTFANFSVDNKDYTAFGQSMGFDVIRSCEKHRFSQEDSEAMILRIINIRNTATQFKILIKEIFEPMLEGLYDTAELLCRSNDLVIGHVGVYPLFIAAEKHGIPHVAVSPIPTFFRTGHAPPDGAPNLGKWANPLLWKIVELAGNWLIGSRANSIRKRAGLSPVRNFIRDFWSSKMLNLICASPSICPRAPDWDDNIKIPGFFDIPGKAEQWDMPVEMSRFLDKGEPPVYLTFGSFTQFNLDQNIMLMASAARLLGRRAIIQAHWEDTSLRPDIPGVHLAGKVPHHRVFPRCAAVVHHGGAGSTQSSLFCGCPSVVVAHAFDQPFWAGRLQRLGVGGKILYRRTVTAEKLASAIHDVIQNRDMKQRAEELGKIMRKEDGVRTAVEMIESYAMAWAGRSTASGKA